MTPKTEKAAQRTAMEKINQFSVMNVLQQVRKAVFMYEFMIGNRL